MTPDPDKLFVDWAERELRHYFGDDLTREAAAPLLSMWAGLAKTRRDYPEVAAELESLILSRFSAEPMVPFVDFLPPVAGPREQCEQVDCHNFGGLPEVCGTGPLFDAAPVEVTAQPTAEAVQP